MNKNIEITRQILFAEKLWSFQLPNHKEYKKLVEQIMLVEKNKELHHHSTSPTQQCHVRALRTSWHSHLEYPIVNAISNVIITQFLPKIIEEEKYKVKSFIHTDDAWINLYKKNNYAQPHSHPHGFSSIYFVKIPPNSCDFLVYNPHANIMKSDLDQNKDELKVNAIEGTVIVFNGHLMHSVTPNLSDKERITMSFNFGEDF